MEVNKPEPSVAFNLVSQQFVPKKQPVPAPQQSGYRQFGGSMMPNPSMPIGIQLPT